ncbi:MAG: response regulator [Chloroflexi bacterium]|nr:response regulator [Chloroflexota bacterium]
MILADKRIFCVEDDFRNRLVVKTILERSGAVVGFHNWGGGDLVARLEEFAPVDIILMDLSLPGGLTGYDVFTTIHSRPQFAAVPIVAVSARDAALEIPRAMKKGFSGFIGKPINMTHFAEQIAAVLTGTSVWERAG